MIKLRTAINAFNVYAYSKHMTRSAEVMVYEVIQPNFALRDGIDLGARIARKGITVGEFYNGANCLYRISRKIDRYVKK